MEATALSMFCRKANFVHLVNSDHCPTIVKQAWNLIAKDINVRDLNTGTPQFEEKPAAMDARKPATLDEDIQVSLSVFLRSVIPIRSGPPPDTTTVFLLPYYCKDGIASCGFDKSSSQSLVYYQEVEDANPQMLHPAQIRMLFRHFRCAGKDLIGEDFVALHEFQPVQLVQDPFATYVDFRAKIYHKEPVSAVKVVHASQIYCHANQRPWDASSVVMRAIDRVSFVIPSNSAFNSLFFTRTIEREVALGFSIRLLFTRSAHPHSL